MKLNKSDIDDEVYYYYLKNGETRWMYRHKYYDSLGRRKEKKKSSFITEKSAYKELLKVKSALLNDEVKQVEFDNITVSQWIDIWYDTNHRDWAVSTKSDIASAVKLHIKPLLGKHKLKTLTSSTYKRVFINALFDDDFSPNSVKLYHKYFMMAINFAVGDEVLDKNRFRNIKIKSDKCTDNFLNPEELNTLLSMSKRHGNITQYTLILLLAYSGMRKGEANGLKWKNIDFKNNEVTIERTRDYKGARSPKTKQSNRSIEIDPSVMNQLKKYKNWSMKVKMTQGKQLDKEHDYVFITETLIDGIGHYYINQFFDKIYEILNENEVKLKRITPHGLRHTHATILLDQMIPPADVADRLGNSIEMIYRVYAHIIKKKNNALVNVFTQSLNIKAN